MIGQMGSLSDRDRRATSMNGKEENRAPWWGYNAFSRGGWYLDTTRKGEGEKDTLLFQSTTIDTISFDLVSSGNSCSSFSWT